MQKKISTAFIILIAIILNVVLMAMLFFLAYGVYHLVVGRFFPAALNAVIIFLIFAASVAATYFIHKAFLRILLQKTGIGKYIHPALLPGEQKQEL